MASPDYTVPLQGNWLFGWTTASSFLPLFFFVHLFLYPDRPFVPLLFFIPIHLITFLIKKHGAIIVIVFYSTNLHGYISRWWVVGGVRHPLQSVYLSQLAPIIIIISLLLLYINPLDFPNKIYSICIAFYHGFLTYKIPWKCRPFPRLHSPPTLLPLTTSGYRASARFLFFLL
ncbi:hypothetical protein ASPWEDRAFT_345481 [Aspergillus wentii DTO 134E9]|uniref:Uncharacterized protein n=1 Tax=Aspergillus wentii DTO 134E9 TaxID=1073089 RepID=A0A1L9RVI0_ASPWE|nr:uncharacterized protein ASPWEDRAFT_345481 [Aspergillus wentii DTO 134E9]OJJ38893.1 hypothetical protein ASPWEDRAFT_345481 [Aspergillus wentii DTO 134E9]